MTPRILIPKVIFKTALALAILLSSSHAAFASEDVSIPYSSDDMVLQDRNLMDCAAAAIFNSFSMGNEALNSSLVKLQGSSKMDKYDSLIQTLTQKPSVHFSDEPNRPRTVRELGGGTFVGDMEALLKDMIDLSSQNNKQYFTGGFSYRQSGEDLHQFSERVHRDLVHSLKSGYPPIISRALYMNGDRRTSHYVVVHTVTALEKVYGKNTFTIKTFDSITGTSQDWRVTERDSFFAAFSWEMNRPYSYHPLTIKNKKGEALSPYLTLTPANAFAFRSGDAREVDSNPTSYMVLEQVFGRMETPKFYKVKFQK